MLSNGAMLSVTEWKTECSGCPLLQRKDWTPIEDEKFNLISIESHSRCNMRCEYCSDTYYGGKEPNYDPLKFIKQFYHGHRLMSMYLF